MDKKINVRKRIIVSTLAITLAFFVLASPIIEWVIDLVSRPSEPRNVVVLQTSAGVDVSWEGSDDIDIKEYRLSLGEQSAIVSDEDNYSFKITEAGIYEFEINAVDYFSMNSSGLTQEINYSIGLEGVYNTYNLNHTEAVSDIVEDVYLKVILLVLAVVAGGFYIIGINSKNLKEARVANLAIYPAVVTAPVILLTFSSIRGIDESATQLVTALGISIVVYILTYFVLLTVNILNNSLYYELPLEQAAKASQFVFSLISSYVVFVIFYGTNFNILEKVVIISPFVFYFSFASISLIKNITEQIAVLRSLSITITMIAALIVLSMWPANFVYVVLALAVIYYILLSISLEVRTRINQYVVTEYVLLVFLIFLILIFNSSWGIMGTLL